MSHTTPGTKTGTKASEKDLWNTSDLAFADAQRLIGQRFDLDACASEGHQRCRYYITPADDALSVAWTHPFIKSYTVWCNPPFSRKTEFLAKAFEESREGPKVICVMIPFEPGTKWWREHVSDKATFVYIPDGRYSFCKPGTREEIGGVPFVSCFVVFTPFYGLTQYVEFKRGDRA